MNNLPQTQSGLGAEAPTLLDSDNVGGLAAMAREQHEIQAAIITAKKWPRDENTAFTKAVASMGRPTMAESATYNFPRGGKNITGPSVDLARELARCWSNIRFGLRIVKESDDRVHIKGYALDAENNSYIEAEDEFQKKIQRKKDGVTTWVNPDERDLRELINRRGAILVRNCILQLLPPDLIETATNAARATLQKGAQADLGANRQDAIRRLAVAFNAIGVTVQMLEQRLEHKLDMVNDTEMAELRGVYKSILDGNTQAHEHFGDTIKDKAAAESTDKLKAATQKIKDDKLSKASGRESGETGGDSKS